ncbi:MAG: hypothetical protein JNN04_15730 [Cyclobacteriaceae bacterium]|nr:hypothetical protein [Cyclobacteriaceae bacterium]
MNMSRPRIFLFLLVSLIGVIPAWSQGVKFTPFVGYTFPDKVYGYYGNVTIGDGTSFGGVLTYEKSSNLAVDLMYSYQSTSFGLSAITPGSGYQPGTFPGSVSYLMLGSRHSPDFNAKVAPYGGVLVGAAIFNSDRTSETWKFAVGGKLGVVYHFNEKFGLMLQTQLLVPVQGVGIYFGTGGAGASTTSSATQFGFTGGLEIKLR